MTGQAPPAIRRPPPDRLRLLADCAYFALKLEQKLQALIELEQSEARYRAWSAGVKVARKLRALLIAERRRHRDRVKSNRHRTAMRRRV